MISLQIPPKLWTLRKSSRRKFNSYGKTMPGTGLPNGIADDLLAALKRPHQIFTALMAGAGALFTVDGGA